MSASGPTVALLGWKLLAHDADMIVRGHGPALHYAFEQAAGALTAVITDKPIDLADHVSIFCRATDSEALFVEWLNAVTYEMAVRSMIFGAFVVRIAGDRLCGAAYGEPIDQKKHEPACEVKGATYTELSVSRSEAGLWVAQCVIDI